MLSSRLWLSISALALGLMTTWSLVSFDALGPIDFARLGPYSLLLHGIAGLVPAVTWFYIFFRPRGRQVMLGSRSVLSLSALLIGGMVTLVLLYFHVIEPVNTGALSDSAFTLFAVGHALPLFFWLTLIVASRGGSALSRG